jgi:hypothetical protein
MIAIKIENKSEEKVYWYYYNYSPMNNNPNNKQFWELYYNNNHTYFKKPSDMEESKFLNIEQSNKDTALGFLHLINIGLNGNTSIEPKQTPVDNFIYGVAFVADKDLSELFIEPTKNYFEIIKHILMTVGCFTTTTAKFYVMVGINKCYSYKGESGGPGISYKLAGFVAKIMYDVNNISYFGCVKNNFITRPLEQMGKLFTGSSKSEEQHEIELNLPYDNTYNLPPEDDSTYNEMKRKAVEFNKQRAKEAYDWLLTCNSKGDDRRKFEECVGDYDFFVKFVSEIFAPRWGYTGKRVAVLEQLFKKKYLKYKKKYLILKNNILKSN